MPDRRFIAFALAALAGYQYTSTRPDLVISESFVMSGKSKTCAVVVMTATGRQRIGMARIGIRAFVRSICGTA